MTQAVSDRLRSLAATASIEVTPRHVAAVTELDGVLPAGTSVYITALPGADPFDLVTAAETIRAAGHVPVPHLDGARHRRRRARWTRCFRSSASAPPSMTCS